ncbi:unnamed protein product [Moritella viscosa]|nr:unnamed protein product [Moritella viscosa]
MVGQHKKVIIYRKRQQNSAFSIVNVQTNLGYTLLRKFVCKADIIIGCFLFY